MINDKFIVVDFFGGLGNQMFQFAFSKSLEYRNNFKLLGSFDTFPVFNRKSKFLLKTAFSLEIENLSKTDMKNNFGILKNPFIRHYISATFPNMFSNLLTDSNYNKSFELMYNKKDFIILHGYWQNYKYFENINHIIKNLYTFNEPSDYFNLKLLSDIRRKNSIAVHVRRGDYLKSKNRSIFYFCDFFYYKHAIEYINLKFVNTKFYFFSDDISWVQQNLVSLCDDYEVIDHNTGDNSYFDMFLMSQCKHQVIANSTFSWWAAWLNANSDKTIIMPKQWFSDESLNCLCNFYVNDWIKI